MNVLFLLIGIAAVCGTVLLWDKWKKDCEKDGVINIRGQE